MCFEETTTYKEGCNCKRIRPGSVYHSEKNQGVLGLRDVEEKFLPDYEQLCPSFLSDEREPLGKCKIYAGILIEEKEKRRTGEERRGAIKGKSSKDVLLPYIPSYYITIINTTKNGKMEIYRGVDAADERDRRYKTAIVFNRCEKCEYQLPFSPTETRQVYRGRL